MIFLLATWTLIRRELVRFGRQRSRILGIIGSPILFWLVIGSGLGESFRLPTAPPTMNFLEYFFPGTLILIILFTAIFSTISIIEDRREGFLQSVLVAPIPRAALVFGKVVGVSILALLQAVLFLAVAPFVGFVPDVASVVLVLPVLFLVAFGLSALGFMIAWHIDSTQGFHAVMNLLLIPMWMLSGALFPVSGAAGWIAVIMKANPLTYGVASTRAILYGMDVQYTKDLPGIMLSLTIILVFCLLTFLGSVAVALRPERGSTRR
jgi:ABC-2 type transport system permease protein